MSSKTFPSLNLERELWSSGVRFVIGMDEVGRGAIAGPVAVGVAILDFQDPRIQQDWPSNLKDSKLLSEKARNEILLPVKDWVYGHAVGMASAQEIDEKGIVAALALSAGRALDQLLGDVLQHDRLRRDDRRPAREIGHAEGDRHAERDGDDACDCNAGSCRQDGSPVY